MALFYLPDFESEILPEAEAKHALQVLRMRKGDLLQLTDGKGRICKGRILQEKVTQCRLEITDIQSVERFRSGEIHLAVAPTKNADRMEWLVEKATELGCNGFHFFHSERTTRSRLNLERLERVALSAIKQSGQCHLPEINWYPELQQLPFAAFDRVVTADLSSSENRLRPISFRKMLLLIGPEGDFTAEELTWLGTQKTESIRFLPQVLRTETAALYALSLGILADTA